MEYRMEPLSAEEAETVGEKIDEYAFSMAPPGPGTPETGQRTVFRAADGEGHFLGGCIVNVHEWGRAVLAKLWVDEKYRRQGLASMLIREAERAAREKGCTYMCLGTTDYQARGLYEKHGYRVFTLNRDIPRGHESYSMSKRLDRPAPDYVPSDNSAAGRYRVEPGSDEDAKIIARGLAQYCDRFVTESHPYIEFNKKLVDGDGRMIAGIVAGTDGDDNGDIDGIWVEEAYRGRGLGSYLLREAERDAKEKGAYVILTNACDWTADFFFKNGYTVRGELEDYPGGHRAYELEKRI